MKRLTTNIHIIVLFFLIRCCLATNALSMENQVTPELESLALELDYDPVKLFSWVYNNIVFEDYDKSRKGAHTTYLTGRGNEWDQSSLLITLLRISNVSARYVQLGGDDVYVEAYLSSSYYRGNNLGGEGRWIPLVPWLKEYRIQQGIQLFPDSAYTNDSYTLPAALDFDTDNTYLSDINNKTALEVYEEQIQQYLNENYPGKSLKDIPYTETIIYSDSSILPASLPHDLPVSTTKTTFDEICNDSRQSIQLYFKKLSNNDSILQKTIYLPQIAGKRFYLNFVEIIGTGQLKPVLYIDNECIAEGTPLNPGERFYPAYEGGSYTYTKRSSKVAGTFIQMDFDSLAASAKTIEKMKIELEQLNVSTAFNQDTRTPYLSRIGGILTTSYFLRHSVAVDKATILLFGKRKWGNPLSPTFIYTFMDDPESPALVDKESKFLIHPQWNIDSRINTGSIYKANDKNKSSLGALNPINRLVRKLYQYGASYNEALIFEDWQDTPSISTIKGLMFANEQNIPIKTYTNDSLLGCQPEDDISLCHLPGLENDSLAAPLSKDTITWIKKELRDGCTVTVPVQQIDFNGMTGFVCMSIGPNYDAYFFNMDYGGATVSEVYTDEQIDILAEEAMLSVVVLYNSREALYGDFPELESSYDEYLSMEDWREATADTIANIPNKDVASEKSLFSKFGDPVNMVSGEFYQEEEPDMVIKSRGFDLSIVRKYRSQLIFNGPFGYGWTWNHAERLIQLPNGNRVFYDSDSHPYLITDNDSDGIFEYPKGSTFTIYHDLQEPMQLVVENKDKTQYYFSNDSKLLRKIDRHGNFLNFEYDSQQRLRAIIDSLSRRISITYNPKNDKIAQITGIDNDSCSYHYNDNDSGIDVVSFTDLKGNTTRYEYLSDQDNPLNNHNMSKYIMPNGDFLDIGYYKNDTVAYHKNKKGNVFNFQYSRLNRYAEAWNEAGYYRKFYFNEQKDVIRIDYEDGTIGEMEYDAYHNMTAQTDGNGNTTILGYYPKDGDLGLAANRDLYWKTNALGETWTYEYNDPVNPHIATKVIDPNDSVTLFAYNPQGKLIHRIDSPGYAFVDDEIIEDGVSDGFITTFGYDPYGHLIEINDSLGNHQKHIFSEDGLYLDEKQDNNGFSTFFDYYHPENPQNMPVGLLKSASIRLEDGSLATTTFEYNKNYQVTTVVDALNNSTGYQYNPNRKQTHTILPNGAIIENVYDTARDIVSGAEIIQTIDPLEEVVDYEYDKVGNLIWKQDKNGNETEYFYDGMNRLIEEINPFGHSTRFFYDGNGNLIKKSSKRLRTAGEMLQGNDTITITASFSYDEANRLIEKIDAKGNSTRYEYYTNSKLKNETHSDLTVTHYEYDIFGNINKKIFAYGTVVERIFTYCYDPLRRLVKETHPKGNYIRFEYDGNGNKTKEIYMAPNDSQIKEIQYVYYADSRNLLRKTIVDGGKGQSNAGTEYEYDALGRKILAIDPAGNEITYEYDVVGNLVRVSTPMGMMRYAYDLRGQKMRQLDQLNNETLFRYDAAGNLIWQRDAEGNETEYYYDARNMKIASIDQEGGETLFDYDDAGNLVTVNHPKNGSTYYEYDRNNNRTKVKRPMGQDTVYAYDDMNRPSGVVDARGRKTVYLYTSLGQPERIEYFNDSFATNLVKSVVFHYDSNGNLEYYNDSLTEMSANLAYDALNRKTGETVNHDTFSLSYSYGYPDQWRRTFTGPDNVAISYDYDDAQRLTAIDVPGSGKVEYTNYWWRSPETISLPGGSNMQHNYDLKARPLAITASAPDGSQLMDLEYAYSPVGNMNSKTTPDGTYAYQYDKLSRLTQAEDDTYTYDDNGNRITGNAEPSEYTYNLNNELISKGSTSFDYDATGSLITKFVNNTIWDFEYDVTGRLAQVTSNDSSVDVKYQYDPFGRRISKEMDGEKTYYFYSDEGLIGEYDAIGDEIKTYGYILGSGWTTSSVFQKDNGNYYWYLNDHLGTPQKLIRSDGTTVWSADYDAFGSAAITSVDGFVNNFRFAGQYFDEETGLHYNWHRYYDPSLGRYLRTDPLGLDGGMNFYVYANNNPLRFTDPEGLIAREVKKDVLELPATIFNTHKEIHYSYNDLNERRISEMKLDNVYLSEGTLSGRNMKRILPPEDVFHTWGEGNENNQKWQLDEPGKRYGSVEIIVRDGAIVRDPQVMGSYNKGGDIFSHALQDVVPYYIFGNSADDPTTWDQRLLRTVYSPIDPEISLDLSP